MAGDPDKDVIYFGRTDFRSSSKLFGIKRSDRRQHVYVVGKTGTGKSALLSNMTVRLYKSNSMSATSTTNSCGQAFFNGLGAANPYSITISAPGYTTYTSNSVTIGGQARLSVTIN